MEQTLKTTEQESNYRHIDKMPVHELLINMNREDAIVPEAVKKAIPQIEKLIDNLVEKFKNGGRLFYIGAGASGRLGVLEASEYPPTFGTPKELVISLIAGGDAALRNAIENAEDDARQGWKDLQRFNPSERDFVLGISASGSTPYVLGALQNCRLRNIATGCIVCNLDSDIAKVADFPIEVIVGPEFVTGSTRLKSGTAQKLVLNMISTVSMIRVGRVKDNKMINMQLSNEKLVDRGVRMLMDNLQMNDYDRAKELLLKYGSVAKAEESFV